MGIFAPTFIGIFTQSKEVIEIGTTTLRAFMLMLPFVGSTSIVRQLVLYIPFLLIFNRVGGFNGLIHAQPMEECVCMVFSLWLVFWYLRKYLEERK